MPWTDDDETREALLLVIEAMRTPFSSAREDLLARAESIAKRIDAPRSKPKPKIVTGEQ